MARFFVGKENIIADEIVIDNREDIHHIANVLRLKEGAVFDVSDSLEWEYRVKLISVSEKMAWSKILDKQRFSAEPNLKVTLFQSIPKQGKMESIIQKSVELGVSSVIPVFTARTVILHSDNFIKKIERWQKVASEAVKQCRRGVVPKVEKEISFSDMISMFDSRKFDAVLFPYENEEGYTIKDALRNLREKPQTLAVVIGPEGGFTDEEASGLKGVGADSVSLGKTVLRTETAGPATIAMVMYELEL